MIYETIKRLGKERGMSVRTIEQKANLSNASISKWAKSSPNMDSLIAVAKVLDCSLDEIIGNSSNVKRSEQK